MTDLTPQESCALKLLKLCASPGKKTSMQGFYGRSDAQGNSYQTLIASLELKGRVELSIGAHPMVVVL